MFNLVRNYNRAFNLAKNAAETYKSQKENIVPKYNTLFKNNAPFSNISEVSFKKDYQFVYHVTTQDNANSMKKQALDSLNDEGLGVLNNNTCAEKKVDSSDRAQLYISHDKIGSHQAFDFDGVKATLIVKKDSIETDEERGTDYVKNGYEVAVHKLEECVNRLELRKEIERTGLLGSLPIGPESYIQIRTFTDELLKGIKDVD